MLVKKKGILGKDGSSFSQTSYWNKLHFLCWTTEKESWGYRQNKILQLLFVHSPDAIVIVISSSLPKDFFQEYEELGYRIYIVPISQEVSFFFFNQRLIDYP